MTMCGFKSICFYLLVSILILKRNTSGANTGPSHGKVVFCYLATYADHRPSRGNFKLEDVNPRLCTHLIYAFALLNQTNDSIYPLAHWSDLEVDQDGKNNITKLKAMYSHLKVTVAVGGWQDGSIKYSNMAADPIRRSRFVNSTLEFLRKHDFDGIDLVWQYPSKRGGSREDKLNYVELVKDLRKEYDQHNFSLTAALDSSKDTIDYGYEVPELSKYLDYMLVMCYDFGGMWSRYIRHNAPLYGSDLLNSAYVIKYMLQLGADPKKVVMGVPLYGRTFIAADPVDMTRKLPGLKQQFKNYTFSGPFTEEDGYMGFNEICLELKGSPSKWKIYWDDIAKVPYAISGEKFITYDNVESVQEKVKFIIRKKLGGVVVWSIDTDDFRGDCHQEATEYTDYPLMRAINSVLDTFPEHKFDDSLKIEDDSRVATILQNSSERLKTNFGLIVLLSKLVCYLI